MAEVRWARRRDKASVGPLFEASIASEGLPSDGDAFGRSWRHAFLPGSTFRFAVAVRDGEVVGACTIHRHFSTYRGDPVVGVEDVFVREDRRGEGAGGALLSFAEAHARSMGAARLELHVEKDNRARALYERRGYEEAPYRWMQKILRRAGEPRGKSSRGRGEA